MKADVQKIPFKDKVFDKILLSSVLQVKDDEILLEECHCVLKDLPMSCEKQRIEVDRIDDVTPKPKLSEPIPRTKQDLYGLIPQDLMMVYRLIRRGHTVW